MQKSPGPSLLFVDQQSPLYLSLSMPAYSSPKPPTPAFVTAALILNTGKRCWGGGWGEESTSNKNHTQ